MAEQATGLDLGEDRRFQRRFWIVERMAWLLMLLVILAALAGWTGQGGPWSRATVANGSGSIDYPRVARWEASDDITISLPPATGRQAVVEIGSRFGDIFEFEDIQPVPAESIATGAGHRLVFDLGEPSGEYRIMIHVRAMRPALGQTIEFRLNRGAPLHMPAVVLP